MKKLDCQGNTGVTLEATALVHDIGIHLVEHHHTYQNVDELEEHVVKSVLNTFFRTETGIYIYEEMF